MPEFADYLYGSNFYPPHNVHSFFIIPRNRNVYAVTDALWRKICVLFTTIACNLFPRGGVKNSRYKVI